MAGMPAVEAGVLTWHQAEPLEDIAKHGGVGEEEAEGSHGQGAVAHVVAAAREGAGGRVGLGGVGWVEWGWAGGARRERQDYWGLMIQLGHRRAISHGNRG